MTYTRAQIRDAIADDMRSVVARAPHTFLLDESIARVLAELMMRRVEAGDASPRLEDSE